MACESLCVEGVVGPDARSISEARCIVDDISRRLLEDEDAGWRAAMAAHELLDNARKYGLDRTTRWRLAIAKADPGHVLVLSVRSRSTPANLDTIKQLAELVKTTDPDGHYRAALLRATTTHAASGLGLARIRAEGEMALTFTCDDEGYVAVEATMDVGAQRR